MHVRKQIVLDKEETQNERGIAPGRTSAVTSFVQKKGQVKGAGPARASSVGSMSQKVSSLSRNGSSQSLSRSVSNGSLQAGGKGRLAKARQGKK